MTTGIEARNVPLRRITADGQLAPGAGETLALALPAGKDQAGPLTCVFEPPR